jgi:hypothetical protein
MIDEKYRIDLYEPEIMYNKEQYQKFSNITQAKKLDVISLLKVETRYSLYKYLPNYLNFFTRYDTINFYNIKPKNYYSYNNINFINYIDGEVKKVDDNVFKFIHIQGSHGPFDLNKDFKRANNLKYEDSLDTSVTILKKYLELLKSNNVYDNSVIIVLGDHGDSVKGYQYISRSNPSLYIKGLNEKHDYRASEEKVSYAYLKDVFIQLSNGDNTDKLFEKYQNDKERYVYVYDFYIDDPMYEYKQENHAWEYDKLISTGKILTKKK